MHIICLKHLLELVKPLSNAIKDSKNNLFKAMFEVYLQLSNYMYYHSGIKQFMVNCVLNKVGNFLGFLSQKFHMTLLIQTGSKVSPKSH